MATLVTHSPLKGTVLPDGIPKPETKKFISLKWKVLLLSSLILFAIVTSFCVISYLSLVDHFENQSDSQHQRYIQEVEGLIEQTSQSLHQFAGTIPFLKGMDTGLLASDGEAILKAFDQHWGLLQLHNGIDLVRFYNTSNRLLARWGIAESEVPDIAFETTMSGLVYLARLKRWKAAGYQIEIFFLRLPSTQLALRRIAGRVKQGGHNVPRADVLRRFKRGWKNFEEHYRALADHWELYDNSGATANLLEIGP